MPDDFFGSLYVELEQRGDQLGWMEEEGISPRAWLAFLNLLRAELYRMADDLDNDTFDGGVAAAMQVAWEAGKRSAGGHDDVIASLRSNNRVLEQGLEALADKLHDVRVALAKPAIDDAQARNLEQLFAGRLQRDGSFAKLPYTDLLYLREVLESAVGGWLELRELVGE